ncbi:MAG: tannase/feruloyl esterase family alpha/beta hydrolase [Bryobacteraceae bacterium]|jgi:feruloyl esterase
MTCRFVPLFAAAGLIVAALWSQPAAFAANCEGLTALSLPNTTITLAKSVPAGSFTPPAGQPINNLPAFCEVHGVLKPTEASMINFEVWLPESNWNGKFEGVGNGGLAGTIGYGPMGTALRSGFATASTDTGHISKEPATWLENTERLIDYSYRGLHLTTVNAKSIADAFYGQAAKYSYYIGCSTGGKQGLMEAQRFPADYDGIVAGDAANFWTHQMMSEVWNGVVTGTPETNLPREKLEIVQTAALAACDALDGAVDGLVSDPMRCHFDVKKLQCKGADGPNCLTAAQVGAVEKIYTGPVTKSGKKLYAGMYPGGELGWGKDGGQMVINRGNTSGVSSYDFWRYAFFHNPEWDFRSMDFERDIALADEKLGPLTNATNPNLGEFQKLGHKMIYYHGAADPLIPAQNGIDYYETVVATQGKGASGLERTQQFYRAFLVPGMYHCAGGPGATAFGGNAPAPSNQVDADHDLISSVSRWVEKGTAPDKIIATKYVDNKRENGVAFQRPLCAYPLVARYKGSGDMKDASNFTCSK